MISKEFNEIIDFAINREKEAVKFYQDLQKMVKFSEQEQLLKDFELMEKKHIIVLQQIQKKGITSIDVPEVEDLHISDYIVERPPSDMMSYQDILITAMKKEEAAYKLYTDLAGKQSDASEKKLFLKLASEEAKHKLTFEKLYDDEVLKQY